MPASLGTRSLPCLLLFLFFAAYCQAQSTPSTGRQIGGPIDESQLLRLTSNRAPSARTTSDLGRVPDDLRQEHVLMMLNRGASQQAALEQFMREQYDPHSTNFHKWLTPDQYGSLYGPSLDDVSQITNWLRTRGFTVNRVAAGRTFIDFSGTAGQITAAFHTEMHRYLRSGETHVANASDPMIPAVLAPLVAGFRALNDFHPKAMTQRQSGHFTSDYGNGTNYVVGPQDFAQIYGIQQVWQQKLVGTGQTIGVIGDTQLSMGDIKNFRDQFGINSAGPNGSVVVDHPPSSVCSAPNSNSPDLEGYVDAEWAGATAPDATIDFVTCADSSVTAGTDLAATYIVQDATHAKQDSVLSSSYGYCEQTLGSAANEFYVQLWQQAAAEGITVVVAAGDAGGAECDEPLDFTYVNHGLAVNGEASTPYNIAMGGTDFSDVFSGTTSQYWTAANSATLESAKSYIPETAWNESCGNPLVLEWYNQQNNTTFSSSSGANGLCTYASTLPPGFFGFPPTFLRSAGAGGLSTVSTRPAWQTGVTGLPSGTARSLPDISMFASAGLTWGHSLIFCYSGSGSGCDYSDANTVYENTDGGTSFVAPAFSGIMALINQKTGDRQGQANNVLYTLASQQYITGNAGTQPNLTTCAAYLGTGVVPGCYFHDVSSTPNPSSATQQQTPFLTGATSVPCTGSATAAGVFTDTSTDPASNSENCFGYQITVTGSGNNLKTTPNYYGVLSTADNDSSPAFSATPGYDLATGLGSPNVYALVNAPIWAGLAVTTTALPDGLVGTAYSQTLMATGRLAPYSWSITSGSLPGGLTLSAAGVISGTPTATGASTFTVQVADAESDPATATATFTVTVGSNATTTVLKAAPVSPAAGQNVTLTATVSSAAGVPTGTVTFLNGTTSLGTGTLNNGLATLTTSFASTGTYTLTATYPDNGDFVGSTSAPLMVTVTTPGFTATVNPTSLTIPFGNPGTVTFTVTPQGGFTGPVNFACGTLPAYFSCSFATAAVSFDSSGAPVANVLTIRTAVTPAPSVQRGLAVFFWLPAFAGLVMGGRKRRRRWSALAVLTIGLSGCGGHGTHQAPDGNYSVPVTLTATGLPAQSFTIPVSVQ